MINYTYIKGKIKEKGFKLSDVANMLGVQYQTINKNLNAGSLETVLNIAKAINVHFIELLEPPQGFEHIYINGVWSGIWKTGTTPTPGTDTQK